jgi:hypothetical protein
MCPPVPWKPPKVLQNDTFGVKKRQKHEDLALWSLKHIVKHDDFDLHHLQNIVKHDDFVVWSL